MKSKRFTLILNSGKSLAFYTPGCQSGHNWYSHGSNNFNTDDWDWVVKSGCGFNPWKRHKVSR